MRVLVIGGSGRVGSGVLPFLGQLHEVVNYDIKPFSCPNVTHMDGSLFEKEKLTQALRTTDGMIYMALGPWPPGVQDSYDINVKGVHCALEAALDAGLKHVVHTSTVSVHDELQPPFSDETMPLQSRHVYGLTKGLGEYVCQYFCRMHGMSILALRLFLPMSHDAVRERHEKNPSDGSVTHRDTARAYDAALRLTDHQGFDAVFISGDDTNTYVNRAKAKRLLGWEPLDRFEQRPNAEAQ